MVLMLKIIAMMIVCKVTKIKISTTVMAKVIATTIVVIIMLRNKTNMSVLSSSCVCFKHKIHPSYS